MFRPYLFIMALTTIGILAISGCSPRTTVPASINILNVSGADGEWATFWFDDHELSGGVFQNGQYSTLSGVPLLKSFKEVRCRIIIEKTKEEKWYIFSGPITLSRGKDLIVVVIPEGKIVVELHPDNIQKTARRMEELRKRYLGSP